MNKNWWYVIGAIVLVLILMFVFRDDVGFSPRGEERGESEDGTIETIFGDEIISADSKEGENNFDKIFGIEEVRR